MGKHGKAYRASSAKVDRTKKYDLDEGFSILDSIDKRKFDETVDVAINLGVDPKQSDQAVRGAIVLPNGIGKNIRVVCVVKGEAEKEARDAGADFVGGTELIEKIEGGWLEFDRVLATPDTVKDLAKIAKILGPKGLMPNKKTGTVTSEIGKAVKEQKRGSVEYKIDKAGIVHAIIGKKSFGADKLKENFLALFDAILKAKPVTSKGIYLKGVAVSPSMGPSVRLDPAKLEARVRGM